MLQKGVGAALFLRRTLGDLRLLRAQKMTSHDWMTVLGRGLRDHEPEILSVALGLGAPRAPEVPGSRYPDSGFSHGAPHLLLSRLHENQGLSWAFP